jgi:hypothetical protein
MSKYYAERSTQFMGDVSSQLLTPIATIGEIGAHAVECGR